jgi:hypothetical protein
VGDVFVGERRLGSNVLGQPAQPGAEDDADLRPLGPPRPDGPLGFLNLLEKVGHESPWSVVGDQPEIPGKV